MGYRVEWSYVGSKRCPIPHSWQTDRLNGISLMRLYRSKFYTYKKVFVSRINSEEKLYGKFTEVKTQSKQI